jgi:pentatricopeptide repeat protein
LADALQIYDGLLAQANDDALLHERTASLLISMACIQRELGRSEDACRSCKRSIEHLEAIVDIDPRPPVLREKLAAAHETLAYSWKINPADTNGRETDAQFRRTLQLYQELERDWPDRRQPVAACLRQLAGAALKRGDLTEAEALWREAIARGKAHLDQNPENMDAHSGLAWACAEVADAILLRSAERAAEAEPILNDGLHQVTIIQQHDARSSQAREVGAFLEFCLARCYCRTGRVDQAIALFAQADHEMESLCAEFPWNRQYWGLVRYFNQETAHALQNAGRPNDAKRSLRQTADWLQTVGQSLPDDTVPQSELRECREGVAELLRASGQAQAADKLERAD